MKNATYTMIDSISFDDAWDLQRSIYQAIRESKLSDTILILEHPHTFTLGKTGSMDHLLLTDQQLHDENIQFSKIDRGGDITYHGPGQMVVYPLLNMNNHYRDVHRYLRDLEEVIIRVLKRFNMDSGRIEGFTGVWVNQAKICAIGVKVSRWITMHGLAFNHTTDVSFFKKIIPCGISDKPVCSLEQLLPQRVSKQLLYTTFLEEFSNVFELELTSLDLNTLNERLL